MPRPSRPLDRVKQLAVGQAIARPIGAALVPRRVRRFVKAPISGVRDELLAVQDVIEVSHLPAEILPLTVYLGYLPPAAPLLRSPSLRRPWTTKTGKLASQKRHIARGGWLHGRVSTSIMPSRGQKG